MAPAAPLRPSRRLLAVAAALVLAYAAYLLASPGGRLAEIAVGDVAYEATILRVGLVCLRRGRSAGGRRAGWTLLGAGVFAWGSATRSGSSPIRERPTRRSPRRPTPDISSSTRRLRRAAALRARPRPPAHARPRRARTRRRGHRLRARRGRRARPADARRRPARERDEPDLSAGRRAASRARPRRAGRLRAELGWIWGALAGRSRGARRLRLRLRPPGFQQGLR